MRRFSVHKGSVAGQEEQRSRPYDHGIVGDGWMQHRQRQSGVGERPFRVHGQLGIESYFAEIAARIFGSVSAPGGN